MSEAAIRFVQLERRKKDPWKATGWREFSITRSLPFYKTKQGTYVHRVRAGTVYYHPHLKGMPLGESHTAFRLWCGMAGHLGGKGTLFAEPAADAIFCATCEGRAIGSGQLGAPVICGRPVCYSPRY